MELEPVQAAGSQTPHQQVCAPSLLLGKRVSPGHHGREGAEGALKADSPRWEHVTADIPAKQEQEICYLERVDA